LRNGRILGAEPTRDELDAYLEAYFGDRLSIQDREAIISEAVTNRKKAAQPEGNLFDGFVAFVQKLLQNEDLQHDEKGRTVAEEAREVASLLLQSTSEMESILNSLDGGYVKPAPGGGWF